eukprot:SAG11_NODE_26014_length_351_cov_0.543651_1_plen_60_part_01
MVFDTEEWHILTDGVRFEYNDARRLNIVLIAIVGTVGAVLVGVLCCAPLVEAADRRLAKG